MKRNAYLLSILLSGMIQPSANAQQKVIFSTLEELYSYAEANSISFRNAEQLSILAKYQTLASKLGMFHLAAPGSFALIENTKLNTNFIPAEVFGGPEGTFRAVTLGQKYMTNFTIEPQIDLINPVAMAQIRVSRTNEQLTAVNNLLNKKAVYESISAAYHNILSYKWQIAITTKSLANADTLMVILQNKHEEGLARSQDVNTAVANRLVVKDKLQQLEIQLEQQNNSLKILCDIDPAISIDILAKKDPVVVSHFPITASSDLLQRQGEWQTKYQLATLRADKRWMYPTLNLSGSFGWQENNNNNFFGTNQWFGSSYIGFKVSMPIFPEASKIAQVRYDRINLAIARNNWNHNKLQEKINNNQLELDYIKATDSYRLAADIEALRKNSYQKNLDIFEEGILSTTDLIDSFDDWLNSSLNTVALLAAAQYAKSKIIISNTIK